MRRRLACLVARTRIALTKVTLEQHSRQITLVRHSQRPAATNQSHHDSARYEDHGIYPINNSRKGCVLEAMEQQSCDSQSLQLDPERELQNRLESRCVSTGMFGGGRRTVRNVVYGGSGQSRLKQNSGPGEIVILRQGSAVRYEFHAGGIVTDYTLDGNGVCLVDWPGSLHSV
jgi:hypothetical protein